MTSIWDNEPGVNVENEARKTVDLSWDSPFHTLGRGSTQASPGNHDHDDKYLEPTDIVAGANITVEQGDGIVTIHGAEAGAPVSDHGALTGRSNPNQHPIAAITDLQTNLNNKSNTNHTHSTYSLTSHTHSYAPTTHTHVPSAVGIRSFVRGPYSAAAGDDFNVGPFTKYSDETVFLTLRHVSNYIFLTLDNYTSTTYEVGIRNSTSQTNHTGIYVHCLHVKTA